MLMIQRGPRPLLLHQTLALSCWQSALCAWHAWKLGWPIWSPEFQSKAAEFEASKRMPEFPAALCAEIQSRWKKFAVGIQKYHDHAYARPAPPYPVIWEQGTTRLYDYLPTAPTAGKSKKKSGIPILVIPSLVNRAYILDLLPEKSFLKFLSENEFHPFLVDWDAPGETEKDFGLSEYITQRLLPIYAFVSQQYAPPAVLGYCMGGNLALALAQLANPKPPALALLATPWDFQAQGMPAFTMDMAEQLMKVVSFQHEFPVDGLQSMFAALDPFGAAQKFVKFAEMDMMGEHAKLFVALEDWLSDGVPLTPKVTEDTMKGWYAQNTAATGGWRVGDTAIHPSAIQIPTLTVLPQQDRIVSPASAAALASAIPGALSLTPDMGHIGMMVGRDAQTRVWEPIIRWLSDNKVK